MACALQNHMLEMDAKRAPAPGWETIRYMVSVVQYGGRITDEYDKLLMDTLAEKYFQPVGILTWPASQRPCLCETQMPCCVARAIHHVLKISESCRALDKALIRPIKPQHRQVSRNEPLIDSSVVICQPGVRAIHIVAEPDRHFCSLQLVPCKPDESHIAGLLAYNLVIFYCHQSLMSDWTLLKILDLPCFAMLSVMLVCCAVKSSA